MIYFTQSRMFCVQNVRLLFSRLCPNVNDQPEKLFFGLVIQPEDLPSVEF